jgi:hypothetical protein
MNTRISSYTRPWLAMVVFGIVLGAQAQDVKPQPEAKQTFNPPLNTAPSQLTMPLMSADQGQRFQQQRVVKASDVPMQQILQREGAASAVTTMSLKDVSGEAMNPPNGKPVLGHVLPTSHVTPLGFPRADFATGAPTQAAQSVKADQPSSSSGLSNAVIK